MAYNSTEIEKVQQPGTVQAPTLNEYQTPDVQTVKPTIDTSKTGYQAPSSTPVQARNLDSGLLEYDPSASKNMAFDGRQVDSSKLGANISNQTPQFATSNNFLTDGAFVQNRIGGLLDDSNPLMQRVKAQGMQVAGARGLQNTTMGATIGQANMIDKALSIATPDAATQAAADTNRQTATYASQQKQQDVMNQGSLAQQTAAINSALSAQTAGQGWDSTQQKAAIQSDLNKQGAHIDEAKANQQAQLASDARKEAGLLEGAKSQQQANISAELQGMTAVSEQNLAILQNKLASATNNTKEQNAAIMQAFAEQQQNIRTYMSATFDQVKAQAQLNAAQRDSLASHMTTMAKDYEISIQNIMLDPNLNADAKNAAITRINKIFNQDMNNIATIFGASYSSTTSGA